MASQPRTLDPGQLHSIVAWLEDQRRQDRDELARLSSEIERLEGVAREQAAELIELRGQVEEGRTALARLPIVDEALRDARERIAHSLEHAEQQSQHVAQTLLLRASDADRDRKQIADLVGQTAKTEDAVQAMEARIRVVVDEARRDRAQLQELPASLHALDQRLGALVHRLDQSDERVRRTENLLAARAAEIEEARAEQTRATQWRQLADVRWSRQAAEWQQTLDEFRQAADEHARPVHQLIAQVGQARDDVRGVQGLLSDHTRRLDDVQSALTRLDGSLAQQREAAARLDQAIEGQRRRFDEQASAQLRLDESIGRAGDQARALEHTAEDQARSIAETQGALRAAEDAIARSREDLARSQSSLRVDIETLGARIDESVERLDALLMAHQGRVDELTRISRDQRQRLAAELDLQARELDGMRGSPRAG
jgi:chromosome segregation ATPase